MVALAGTELEFIAFDTSYEDAHDLRWRGLTPVNQYNVDYSILGTTRVEPLLRDIRNPCTPPGWTSRAPRASATSASTRSASCTPTRWSPPTTTASTRPSPRRSPPSAGRRSRSWRSTTSARATPATSTCRCAATTATVVFWDGDGAHRRSTTSFIAGVLATMHDFTLLYAPNINSYKRFAAGSFAPTAIAWGARQPHLRRAPGRARPERPDGEPPARRRREPLPRPRRDAGRRPARHRAGARARGRAGGQRLHTPTSRTCRTPCARRATPSHASAIARAAFGDEVVDHYTNMADVELAPSTRR